ncbi:MAG TPA: ABC transporter substrate-binding protein/permease [Nitrospirota bacterium]|nr:ABC transporter substrate-binding protein/permease [Nitrospirota bacterium]
MFCRKFRVPALPAILLLSLCLLSGQAIARPSTVDKIKKRGVLLWGCDIAGGAPLAFPDPKDPSKLVGFEADIAEAIARDLGVRARVVQTEWGSLIPALERGDYDIAMNGIEIIPERLKRILMSRPYYAYTLQVVVRKDEERTKGLADLRGKTVGTLAGTTADGLLKNIGVEDIRSYSEAWPFEDVALGRLDAAFLDTPIAIYYAKPDRRLRFAGTPVGEGYYGIAIRKEDQDLKRLIDASIDKLLRTGELKRIYDKWGLWDKAQSTLFNVGMQNDPAFKLRTESADAPLYTFFPLLLKGAGITVLLSVVSMALAILLGLSLALVRQYGPPALAVVASTYVEIYRGTPLLIQLFILYYGLPNVGITLSPLTAAILGLGMNYAAYESEVYRAGLEAVPLGQWEAALSLGMSNGLVFRRVVFPQAFRISLPAVTNDFIALFKDSSIVSVIAMVELTKTYGILAATTLRYFQLGLVVALLYFGMSYPLSLAAGRLERNLKGRK